MRKTSSLRIVRIPEFCCCDLGNILRIRRQFPSLLLHDCCGFLMVCACEWVCTYNISIHVCAYIIENRGKGKTLSNSTYRQRRKLNFSDGGVQSIHFHSSVTVLLLTDILISFRQHSFTPVTKLVIISVSRSEEEEEDEKDEEKMCVVQ